MNWLVRLYPSAWRKRYGEEFQAIMAERRLSFGIVIDVLAGAFDAHLHPQVHVQETELTKGETMTAEMMQRCAAGGPVLSKKEQITAGTGMVVGSLILAAVYVVLRAIYHGTPAVEGLGYTIFPGMLVFYAQIAYLRKWTFRTQIALVGGMLGSLYLLMWGACAIAAALEPVGRQ